MFQSNMNNSTNNDSKYASFFMISIIPAMNTVSLPPTCKLFTISIIDKGGTNHFIYSPMHFLFKFLSNTSIF